MLPRRSLPLESALTLIVCPSHLVQQWQDEIAAVSALRVIVITTMSQWSKITYRNLLASDVVIVSYQFLANKNYLSACGSLDKVHDIKLPVVGAASRGTRSTRRATAALAIAPESAEPDLECGSPILQLIGWHRIVADEAHEVLAKRESDETPFTAVLASFLSNYRWIVTGTPFPYGEASLSAALAFLHVQTNDDAMADEPLWYRLTVETFHERLFWRNTKDSVDTSRFIPPLVEEVIFLTQTPVEAAMYRAAEVARDYTRMRQLCCHPQISAQDRTVLGEESKTLEEIRIGMIAHLDGTIEKLKRQIRSTEGELRAHRERVTARRLKVELKAREREEQGKLESDKERQERATKEARKQRDEEARQKVCPVL